MEKDGCGSQDGCQLKSVHENINTFARQLSIVDRVPLLLARLKWAALRRLNKTQGVSCPGGIRREHVEEFAKEKCGRSNPLLQSGDVVVVRSLKEIELTLEDGKTGGLQFMPGMAQYCGMRTRVFKRVRYMFDERAWGMLKCNAVLLEGVICNGKNMYDQEGCDRSCFFFWKDTWLRKVQN